MIQIYEQYKDSGIDWIGQIPEHWEIKRFKYLFNEINERSIDGNEELLSVSQYTGVTKKSDKIDDGDLLTNASTLEGYKKVRKHQLVSNIMLAWNGSLAFSEYNGITSPAYCIYELKHDDVYKYFHYLFKTDFYKSEFKRNSSGVIESRLRLYTDDFFSIWSVLPPIHEQHSIAKFLDEKTAKIDALVQTKEQQIEKLKELRQAKIHQVVTKGLDANAPTKDSGVEWIGEIPAHWEVKRLKNLFQIVNGATPSSAILSYWGGDITWVTPKDVNNIKYISESERNISISGYKSCGTSLIPKGSIILTTRAPIGKVVIANKELCTNQGCKSLVKINNQNNEFIYSVLDISSKVLNSLGTGTTFMELSNVALKNFQLPIPPIQEQEQIVAYLDEVTGKIDQAIAQKQEQITKLKEYKQSLINDVVTGKVKVC
ncbi:restriction endonuclease subunit S [Empedobacter falsenii]|uniref:Restriction endonuclease subunit S n=1 Tax=Empedobacter falsenii TaxID=343874 RepID=A0ABY8VC13_9FLAO|nr:restriction endonuclease subunit S [Empedobacter falsenii]WIH97779.1 restriction endonuclease subunit S [Empedobacter falsenii]